jgi:adenylylsulfate kinase-like enzyme
MSRDPKGHYKNQYRDGIKNFVGLDIPFQVPENPDLVVNTESDTIDHCMGLVSTFFNEL